SWLGIVAMVSSIVGSAYVKHRFYIQTNQVIVRTDKTSTLHFILSLMIVCLNIGFTVFILLTF
ncbi:hypothetical protein RCJ22_09140, partial [Vibrio sp. FNV 38]|nr:hypothetical protein [Vibrio sp. FNV 38]